MKHILLFVFILTTVIYAQQLQSDAQKIMQDSNNSFFIENKGQWPDQVRYLTKIGGLNAWITDNGVVYDYYKIERNYTQEKLMELPPPEQTEFEIENTSYLNQVVRVNYLYSLSTAGDERLDKKPGHHNYYIGDKSRHAENVELFGEVRVSEIYEGIDIRYYFDEGQLRYDYKAAPNADISQIRMEVEGADDIIVNAEGELVMQTQFGEVLHGKLLAYQNKWYGVKTVECGFVKNTDGTVSVNTAEYDRNKVLTIDPLVYSTFLGGTLEDRGIDVDMTSGGDYVVTGYTKSTNFPTTDGSSYSAIYDVFITQIDGGGATLDYSTYYGTTATEYAYGLTIYNDPNDGLEKVGIAGTTSSPSILTTDYDFSTTSAGNFGAVVLVLLVQDGSKDFDVMVDGNNSDTFWDIVHDSSSQLLILGGFTNSSDLNDLPFSGSYYGDQDAILFVIPYSDPTFAKGIYYGGTGYDRFYSVAVRELTGNVFGAGNTESVDLLNTTGGIQGSHSSSPINDDLFIVKLDPGDPLVGTPPSVITATYYGGTANEFCEAIEIEQTSGDIYAVGETNGSTFPTVNPYQATNNGSFDGIIAKFSNDLSACYFASYLGGSGIDLFYGVTVKDDNRPVVIGYATSNDMPVTSGAVQSSNANTNSDVFVYVLSPDGSELLYGSYLGGSGNDRGDGIAMSPAGNVIITGRGSTGFPTTATNYQGTNAGDYDAIVSVIELTEEAFISLTAPNGGENWPGGSSQNITWMSTGMTNVKLEYSTNNGTGWTTIIASTAASAGSYSWTVADVYSTNCLVRISDASDGAVNDVSDAVFTIDNRSLTVTAPNGGESWESGTAQAITWNSNGVSNVKIEYSTNNGSGWSTIVNSLDAAIGSFNWTVPNTPSVECLVRITDVADGTITDQSAAFFEIFSPTVAVTAPDGGETYRAGTTETITWTASGIDNVKIEYSTDNGSNWTLIDPSVAGSLGTFDWTVPNVTSTQCLIRLSDELDPTIVDVSDAIFTIEKPSVTLNYVAGWNILSAPFNLDDPTASNVFPTKTSDIFAYSYGYYIIYNIQPAQGFWVKFPSAGSNTVDGSGSSDSTVQVFAGWNIIGAPEYDVAVGDITPTNIISSDFYEYGGGYTTVTILQEGKGYWVKCSQPGTLLLPRQAVTKVEPLLTPEEDWITVTVTDAAGNSQQLYVADAPGMFELPPVPPAQIFDARFGDNSYLCTEDALSRLRFQSEDYPLTISVSGGNLKLTDGATGTIINRQLLDGESMTITNKNIGNLNINTVEIPADYVLYQNYPNPFNPATTIKFGLPQAGKVEITVYDQLGQKVETLINKELEAGYHELEWNAMQYSSGVYFYTINSGNFKSVKKMLLLK